MPYITPDFLRDGASEAGGWNRAQLRVIGVAWPPIHGWRDRLLGQEISAEAAAAFLALKGEAGYASSTRKLKAKQQARQAMKAENL